MCNFLEDRSSNAVMSLNFKLISSIRRNENFLREPAAVSEQGMLFYLLYETTLQMTTDDRSCIDRCIIGLYYMLLTLTAVGYSRYISSSLLYFFLDSAAEDIVLHPESEVWYTYFK